MIRGARCIGTAPLILPAGMVGTYNSAMKGHLSSVTPMIPAGTSLAAAIEFYTAHLGFSIVWQNGSMAGIKRDGIAFNLLENDNRAWVENSSFSVGVSNLDALHDEYRNVPARVGPLEMKAWGRREFHLIEPAGVCFQFYEQKPPAN
jgi:catechol 2,3-dioxygenase-like lactoylglutathione lyase family enzyme